MTASQTLASDPGYSVFVTANAGSGKTKVLVDRIARLLLRGGAPSSFLCITFTKAAAAEMQRRLFERLGGWSIAPDDALAAELEALDPDSLRDDRGGALARARALFARALETPGGLRIQTFHGFCECLLRRFPLEAGVPAGFRVLEPHEAQRIGADALEEALATAEGITAFETLARRLPLQDLEALAAVATEKIPDAADAQAWSARRHGVNRTRADAESALWRDAPWADLLAAAERLRPLGGQCEAVAARIAAAHASRDRPDALEKYLAVFLKDDGQPRRDGPTKKARDGAAFINKLFSDDGEQGRVATLAAELCAIDRASEAAALVTLTRLARGAYLDAASATGALDFDMLIARAEALLSRSASAAWVLYKLDGAIDHLLIDEGQDTSASQWTIVRPIEEEFFAGDDARPRPRTVFAVGDPKQSIYAFQGADPAAFLAESQRLSRLAYAAGRAFAAPSLEMSFRSTPEVLRLVDAVFANASLGVGDPGRHDLVRHTAWREKERGAIEWWPHAPRPDRPAVGVWDAPLDQESAGSPVATLSAAVAAWCARMIEVREAVWEAGRARAVHAGDILILVQRRGPLFQQIIRSLKKAGLPVAGADRMTLRDELAVEDLLALARAALDPTDDLTLASVLKGPFIGLIDDDRDIFPLAHGRPQGERLWDRLRAATEPRFVQARTILEGAIAAAGAHPHAFLTRILEAPGPEGQSGWAQLFARLGEEARDPVEEMLERALSIGGSGPATLQRFVHMLETDEEPVKREMEGASEAVRVMTVHGAKGLEAPVVVLPDTAAPPRARAGLVWSAQGPAILGAQRQDDGVCAAIRADERAAAEAEYLRLLYVALTRARDRLLICAHATGPGEGAPPPGSWHTRVGVAAAALGEAVETPFGEGFRFGAVGVAPPIAAPPAKSRIPAWALTPVSEPPRAPPERRAGKVFAFSPEGQSRFARGLFIHGLLQRLPDVPLAERLVAGRAWLTPQGLSDGEAEALVRESLRVIEDPRFAAAFGPGSRAEATLAGIGADGRLERGIVDRLVIGADEVLVLDFKTDRPAPEHIEDAPPAYLAQLGRYRRLLRAAFPGRRVRAGLLWTEAPRLLEAPETLLERAADPG